MDPYASIAAYYDLQHADFDDDIRFYLEFLRVGPVLEVGAGTGRLMLPLARAGLEVWGVDPSTAMLAEATRRLGSLPGAHIVHSSIQDLDIELRFHAVVFSLNSLWHLPTVDAQLTALRNARRHLLPGGVLVIDLTNPLTMVDRSASGEVRQRFECRLPGRTVSGYSACWDDEGEQRLTLSMWYDDIADGGELRRSGTRFDLRYVYRTELELLVQLAGFATQHTYGSYDLENYVAASSNIILTGSAR